MSQDTPHRPRRRALWYAVALVCAIVMMVWLFVVPDKVDEATGIQQLAIRWAHPLCWGLFAVAALLTAFGATKRLRDGALYAAGASYAAFLAALALPVAA